MVEGLDTGGLCPTSLCKTLSPLWVLSLPVCALKGPFSSEIVCQCQEDFPLTCCFGRSVLASVLRGWRQNEVEGRQDGVELPGCSFP